MSIPPDQYELYAEFGLASEKAQVLELEAGNVALSFLMLFVDTDHITTEQSEAFRSLIDDLDRKTLGTLLRKLKSLVSFDDSLLQVVDEAVERRNYLTHKFFRTHNFAILGIEGRKAMVAELREIRGKLSIAHAMLHGVSTILDTQGGRTGMAEAVTKELEVQAKRVEL